MTDETIGVPTTVGTRSVAHRARRSALRGLTALAGGIAVLGSAVAAQAGGYVAPIIEFTPPPVPIASVGAAPNYWLALIPLGLLFFASRDGGDGTSNPPRQVGGPCFCEGTLIRTPAGWVPVETIRAGDLVSTSKGQQAVLSASAWQPTQFPDRPAIVAGVRLSVNHGVSVGDHNVDAGAVSPLRGRIDGRRYIHILVEDHSWLEVKATAEGQVLRAESLQMTPDLKLSRDFPQLVARHAANPVAPRLSRLDEAQPIAA